MMRLSFLAMLFTALLYTPSVCMGALVSGPFLHEMTPKSVTVVWETQEETIGTVQVGQNEFNQSASDSKPANIHRIQINGLTPNTLYSYRCRWNDQITNTFTFKTAPPRGGDGVKIAIISGTAGNQNATERLADQIHKVQPHLIFHAGRVVSQPTSPTAWRNELFNPLGSLISITPIDFILTGFNQRPVPFSYVGTDQTYGAFELGNFLLVRLDDSLVGDAAQTQASWLDETLRSTQQKWIIVFIEQPLFSANTARSVPPNRWLLQPVLQTHQADLVVASGDSFYHRTYPIGDVEGYPQYGVCHVNVGGAASPLPSTLFSYTAFRENRRHFLTVESQGDRLLVKAIDESGRGFDSFVRDKDGGVSPTEFVSFEMMELERDLNDWIDKTFYQWSTVEIHGEANVPTRFTIPLRGSMTWNTAGSWTVASPVQSVFRLAPEQALAFEFTAAYSQPEQLYPLPQLQIQLAYDEFLQDYRNPIRGFRNSTIVLSPLQVVKPLKYVVPKATGRIDRAGSVEPSWAKALYIDNLFVNQTGAEPAHSSRIGFLHDGEFLYIYAKMLQDPSFVQRSSVFKGRDHQSLYSNEHLRFSIRSGQDVYTYLLSSNGERLDSKNGDVAWSVEWDGAAVLATDAWEAEMKLPVGDVLRNASNGLKMSVSRYDAMNHETNVLIPSYARPQNSSSHMASVTFDQ